MTRTSAMPPFLSRLAAAPHRPAFLAGAVQGVLTMLWWMLELESRLSGGVFPDASGLTPGTAHAWLMLYGFFPFFVFGFLFTALPNWVNGGPVLRRDYLAGLLPMAAGAGLFYPGLYIPGLAALAVLLHAAGWAVGLAALFRVLRRSPAGDKRQPWITWAALLLGLAGDLAFLAGLPTGQPLLWPLAESLAVWGFLTPLFLAVCHRMIPWFTSRVVANQVIYRPYAPLWAMLAACLLHVPLETAGLAAWTWPADLALAVMAFRFTARWGIARSFGVRLLAMLHLAFLWAGFAFLLYAADGFMASAGLAAGLGLAPLHALGVGFFGAMLVGMASRVSLGHSGRPLAADGATWLLFWLLQATALVRVLPDLWPAAIPHRLLTLAALAWLLVFAAWAWKYAPMYWRPRLDGKPG